MAELHETTWGDGEPVLLVHGSVTAGEETWQMQRPLADAGFRLRVIDRRGYGSSPAAQGEDYYVDAEDIVALLEDEMHLVGHSYGGIASLIAAARAPGSVRSLAVVEPPLYGQAAGHPAVDDLVRDSKQLWADTEGASDRDFLLGFLTVVGEDPAQFPDHMIDSWIEGARTLRHGRPVWEAEIPIEELAAAPFPKLVVSGGHSPAFEAVCDVLAEDIGARKQVIEGAGHDVPFTGEHFNQALAAHWRDA